MKVSQQQESVQESRDFTFLLSSQRSGKHARGKETTNKPPVGFSGSRPN